MKKQTIIPIVKPTLEAYSAYAPLFKEAIESGRLTMGKNIAEFEKNLAKYIGVKHCVAVSSCTAGLMLVLKGLDLKGEVILPSFTFSASAHALMWNGLTPVFADIDPHTYTLDPKSVEKLITPRTSAILATHPFGAACDVKKLQAIARKHKLKLVYDAAHAFGTEVDGARVGNFGDAEVFSCSPVKILTAAEGGIIATNNDALATFCREGRNYGEDGSNNNNTIFPGLSARMSEFHAAIGLRSLAKLSTNLKNRRASAKYLMAAFKKIEPGIQFQISAPGSTSTYYVLSAYIDSAKLGYSRDQMHDFMYSKGIMTRKYFFPALHNQTSYKAFAPKKGSLPITDMVAQSVLSLPLYSHISKEDMNRVIEAFQEFKDTI